MHVSYRLVPVDRITWGDKGYLDDGFKLTSASVTKEATDGSCLIDSGTFQVSIPLGEGEFEPGWYRLKAYMTGDMASELVDLATLWVYPTGDSIDKGRVSISCNGASVLQPLAERQVLVGDFIAKGASATEKIRTLISEATPAPVEVLGSFSLNDYYVFDPGTSYLDIVWGLLRRAGWCMQITGDGTIIVREKPSEASHRAGREERSIFRQAAIGRQYSRANVPNRLKVIDAFGHAYTVENHQAGSKTSYEAVGRWIDAVDTSPQPKDGETIPAYARRQMEIMSTVSYLYTYSRNWMDSWRVFDIIEATLPNHGFSGKLRITRQQITCGVSLKVDETAGYEVKEFEA